MGRLQDRMIEELRLRGYSKGTIAAYPGYVRRLARYHQRSPAELSNEEIRQFLLHLLQERKVSSATFNCYCCALRFLYREVLGREELWREIHFHRRPRKLTQVLSREEVAALLAEARNLRDQAIFSTMYASGLRLGEVLQLEPTNVDSQRMVLRVTKAKGGKERQTLLPEDLLRLLRQYWRQRRPKGSWLFPGRAQGRPVHRATMQRAFVGCRTRAGISKAASVHSLRHSFATHLLEDGVDLRVVQHLLGHKSLRTTAVYLHVTKRHLSSVRSPFEGMMLQDRPPEEDPDPER